MIVLCSIAWNFTISCSLVLFSHIKGSLNISAHPSMKIIFVDPDLVYAFFSNICAASLKGGLHQLATSHLNLQKQLTAKADKLEMCLRRTCIIFTVLSKPKNEDLRKLQKDVLDTLRKTWISKDEIIKIIDKLLEIGKTNKNKTQNTI